MQNKIIRPAVQALVIALGVGAAPASSEEAGEIVLAQLDAMTVYATRNPTTAFDYPGQVTVLGREILLDFNPSSIGDVFDAIPGAQFDAGPRRTGDAPTVRGISGDGVQIFLDGARQSFVSGHDGRFFVDPDLVQAVEVIRGPTSALYGSGALGGVIATRTITAKDVLSDGEQGAVRVGAGYQSVNEEYRAGVTGVWRSADDMFDAVGHLTYRESGDIELGSGFSLPSEDEIYSSLLKFTYRPAQDLELFASWMRYAGESQDPQNPQGANVAGPDNALVARDVESNTVQGGLNWDPDSDLININLTAYYSDNSVEEDEVEDTRVTDRSVETFGVALDNRSTYAISPDASVTFTYGAEYYRDEQTGLDTQTADGSRGGVPDATTDFYGVFLQAEVTIEGGALPGSLSVIPGVRWDSFESSADGEAFNIDETEVSPKIGIAYKPVPQFLLFGNYAEGFRAPSFNEAFADGVHFSIPNLTAPPGPFGPTFVSNVFIGNPDLQPEASTTWELGAGIDFKNLLRDGDAFTAKASYYQSDVDNLIGLDVNTPAGCFVPSLAFAVPCGSGAAFGNTSQNVNIASAEIDGVEVEFRYDSDYFYVRGNFAAIDGVDADTGEFLEGVLAPNTLFVDAGGKYAPWGLRAGVRVTAAETFDEVNDAADERDSFTVADLYAVWEPPMGALEGVRIDLGVDNVADEDYEIVNAGVSQPGRNYKIAVSWRKGF